MSACQVAGHLRCVPAVAEQHRRGRVPERVPGWPVAHTGCPTRRLQHPGGEVLRVHPRPEPTREQEVIVAAPHRLTGAPKASRPIDYGVTLEPVRCDRGEHRVEGSGDRQVKPAADASRQVGERRDIGSGKIAIDIESVGDARLKLERSPEAQRGPCLARRCPAGCPRRGCGPRSGRHAASLLGRARSSAGQSSRLIIRMVPGSSPGGPI